MEIPEFLSWLIKALGGGVLSYLAQRILKKAEGRLNELRAKPLKATDQELEELLTHLVEELGALEDLTIQDALRVVRMRFAISRAYLQIRTERLKGGKGRPGGT